MWDLRFPNKPSNIINPFDSTRTFGKINNLFGIHKFGLEFQ
jgi:hypothetical protein